jgi:hypothetical protein
MKQHNNTNYPTALNRGKIAANSTRHLPRAVAAVLMLLLHRLSVVNRIFSAKQHRIVSMTTKSTP